MWRIYPCFAVLQCFFTLNSNAQLLVGPVAGAGVSKVYFFDHNNYNYFKTHPSISLDAGLMASLVVHKNYVLNAQLLYSYRSKHVTGVNGPGSDAQFKLSSNMQYLELPIFYVLEFKSVTGNATGHGGRVKTYNWFVGGGPTISYWMSAKTKLQSSNLLENNIDHINYTAVFKSDNSTTNQPITSTQEFISDANRFQFAINITGGIAFEPVGLHKIVTFAQLNIAQTFFAKSDVSLPTYDVDVMRAKNHSIKLSIAYLFDTKIEKSRKGKSSKSKEVQRKRK